MFLQEAKDSLIIESVVKGALAGATLSALVGGSVAGGGRYAWDKFWYHRKKRQTEESINDAQERFDKCKTEECKQAARSEINALSKDLSRLKVYGKDIGIRSLGTGAAAATRSAVIGGTLGAITGAGK